jgi:hypothetical protein
MSGRLVILAALFLAGAGRLAPHRIERDGSPRAELDPHGA